MLNKPWWMVTKAELKAHAKLNPKEQAAVDALLAALRAMPRSLWIDKFDDEITISKRYAPGAGQQVAKLRKKSLEF